MSTNITPRPKQSSGATQASKCVKHSRAEEEIEEEVVTLTPEQHRQLKIDEALANRRNLDRLLKAANERFFEERRYKV